MSRLVAAIACVGLLSLAGCRDDFNSNDAGDGDGDGDNMLGNASFETWLDGTVQVWDGEGATLTQSDDATDGMYSVQVAGDTYATVGQPVSANLPLAGGTCLRLGADLKWVSGASAVPAFLLNVTYEDETEGLLGEELSWVADGEWHTSDALIQAPQTITRIAASIGSASPNPQAYLVDKALLRIEDCG